MKKEQNDPTREEERCRCMRSQPNSNLNLAISPGSYQAHEIIEWYEVLRTWSRMLISSEGHNELHKYHK